MEFSDTIPYPLTTVSYAANSRHFHKPRFYHKKSTGSVLNRNHAGQCTLPRPGSIHHRQELRTFHSSGIHTSHHPTPTQPQWHPATPTPPSTTATLPPAPPSSTPTQTTTANPIPTSLDLITLLPPDRLRDHITMVAHIQGVTRRIRTMRVRHSNSSRT